ncbi:uncharacterized protein LOC144079080 [Stigmatopora argus]
MATVKCEGSDDSNGADYSPHTCHEVHEEYLGDMATFLQARNDSLELQLAKTKADLEQAQSCLQQQTQQQTQHRSEVERTVTRLHDQLTSTVAGRLEQVQDCLRSPCHETSRVRTMVTAFQRRFAAMHARQKAELRLLFKEQ